MGIINRLLQIVLWTFELIVSVCLIVFYTTPIIFLFSNDKDEKTNFEIFITPTCVGVLYFYYVFISPLKWIITGTTSKSKLLDLENIFNKNFNTAVINNTYLSAMSIIFGTAFGVLLVGILVILFFISLFN